MSIKLMTKVWDRDDIAMSEKMVLLALADYSNDDGHCWPSVEKLSTRCCIGERQIRRIIKKFESVGMIEVKNRGRRSNYYIINVDIYPDTHVRLNDEQEDLTGHLEHAYPDTHVRFHKNRQGTKRPATEKQSPAPRQITDHTWFVRWWCFACQQIVGSQYAITKKDAGQVKKLLQQLGLYELVARACVYFTLDPGERFPRGSPTIGGLQCQINELASRYNETLENKFIASGLLPDLENAENFKTFEPWKGNQ